MPPNKNIIVLIGRLTEKPTLRQNPQGELAAATLANEFHWIDRATGEKKKHVNFIPITAYGHTAKKLSRGEKGTPLCIEGKLRIKPWQNAGGSWVKAFDVVPKDVEFLESLEQTRKRGRNGE